MHQAVQAGRGQKRISEQVWPFGGSTIAGDHDAPSLISLVNNVIQVFRRGWLKGLESKVVQDEQIRTQVAVQTPLPRTVCPASIQVLQHLVRVDEQNLEALPTSFLAKGLSEMRFPNAG